MLAKASNRLACRSDRGRVRAATDCTQKRRRAKTASERTRGEENGSCVRDEFAQRQGQKGGGWGRERGGATQRQREGGRAIARPKLRRDGVMGGLLGEGGYVEVLYGCTVTGSARSKELGVYWMGTHQSWAHNNTKSEAMARVMDAH